MVPRATSRMSLRPSVSGTTRPSTRRTSCWTSVIVVRAAVAVPPQVVEQTRTLVIDLADQLLHLRRRALEGAEEAGQFRGVRESIEALCQAEYVVEELVERQLGELLDQLLGGCRRPLEHGRNGRYLRNVGIGPDQLDRRAGKEVQLHVELAGHQTHRPQLGAQATLDQRAVQLQAFLSCSADTD